MFNHVIQTCTYLNPGSGFLLNKLVKALAVLLAHIPVRHESAPPLVAESATGKARPSAFRI